MKIGKISKSVVSGTGGEAVGASLVDEEVVGVADAGGEVAAVIWIGVALRVLVKYSWVWVVFSLTVGVIVCVPCVMVKGPCISDVGT